MTEAGWKLVVDRQGVTIANDRFQLRTNGSQESGTDFPLGDAMLNAADSSDMESVVSQLQSMTWRTYGQFCALAHALEIIGERWAMLIVRDLLAGAKTFDDVRQNLPRMPIDLLTTRLKELEHAGVIRRKLDTSVVYELTEHGRELDSVALALARWGAKTLSEPMPEDVVTTDSLILLLRAAFQPQLARGVRMSYELRFGEIVVHACVNDGVLECGPGPLPYADLVIEAGPVIRALMAGDISPAEAIAGGSIRLMGNPCSLPSFVQLFHIPRPAARPI